MSDLFHEELPAEFIAQVFDVMRQAYWHTFQILTKRSERLASLASSLPWPPNVWMGVSVERNDYVHRVGDLRTIPAAIRFLSLEPLLGPLPDLDLTGIHWAIVGGESGPGARPMKQVWVLDILTKCQERKLPFFFKQWGGVNKKKAGRLLAGTIWDEYPR